MTLIKIMVTVFSRSIPLSHKLGSLTDMLNFFVMFRSKAWFLSGSLVENQPSPTTSITLNPRALIHQSDHSSRAQANFTLTLQILSGVTEDINFSVGFQTKMTIINKCKFNHNTRPSQSMQVWFIILFSPIISLHISKKLQIESSQQN